MMTQDAAPYDFFVSYARSDNANGWIILRCLRARLDQLGLALLGHQQTQALTALGPQLHLLATTRLIPPAGGQGNWLSLGQLPDDDALDLLKMSARTCVPACASLPRANRAVRNRDRTRVLC
jgi:hypothetical protein